MPQLKTPAIGQYVRSIGRLVDCENVTPPIVVPVQDFIFESYEAVVCSFAGGVFVDKHTTIDDVDKHTTIDDFYGENTCVEIAIDEARKIFEKYKRQLEIRVIKRTTRCRYRRNGRENFYDPSVEDFTELKTGSMRGMPYPIEEVVWCSNDFVEKEGSH